MRSVRNGRDDSIRRRSGSWKKEKSNHFEVRSGFASRTFWITGRVSRRLQRRSFYTLPTWCKKTPIKLMIRTRQTNKAASAISRLPLFLPLGRKEKWRLINVQGLIGLCITRAGAAKQPRTTLRNINILDMRTQWWKLIMTLQIKMGSSVSVSFSSLSPFGFVLCLAESKTAPMWTDTSRLRNVAHFQGDNFWLIVK